jgi:hypothetical protein
MAVPSCTLETAGIRGFAIVRVKPDEADFNMRIVTSEYEGGWTPSKPCLPGAV